jgi:ABC-type nitrate/sulfonate/bicarbonate transport system permease component
MRGIEQLPLAIIWRGPGSIEILLFSFQLFFPNKINTLVFTKPCCEELYRIDKRKPRAEIPEGKTRK